MDAYKKKCGTSADGLCVLILFPILGAHCLPQVVDNDLAPVDAVKIVDVLGQHGVLPDDVVAGCRE